MSSDNTDEKMIEFIRILKSIEDDMEPYKEAKRELRKDFIAQGWLSREEISVITRAYRMLRKNERKSHSSPFKRRKLYTLCKIQWRWECRSYDLS